MSGDNMTKTMIKGLILVAFMTLGMSKGFGMNFKLNSSHDKLNGGFKSSQVKIMKDKITGTIELNSMWSSKPEKREDLLDYFEASDFPVAKFEVKIVGKKLEGKGKLKGEDFKLVGEIEGNKAKIRLSLKKLIGGFKSNFIDKKDNVELIIKLKK